MLGRNEGQGELTERIAAIAGRLMGELGLPGQPRLDAPLGEGGLGFDSMGKLDLLAAVEKECAVAIPEKYWGPRQLKNLADLARVAVRRR